jgi:hypothetical protein
LRKARNYEQQVHCGGWDEGGIRGSSCLLHVAVEV